MPTQEIPYHSNRYAKAARTMRRKWREARAKHKNTPRSYIKAFSTKAFAELFMVPGPTSAGGNG